MFATMEMGEQRPETDISVAIFHNPIESSQVQWSIERRNNDDCLIEYIV